MSFTAFKIVEIKGALVVEVATVVGVEVINGDDVVMDVIVVEPKNFY